MFFGTTCEDAGEMRRVLNAFLQFLEADGSDSLILAATNHQEILDPALFRRFDDVIHYGLPEADHIERLAKNRLNMFRLNCVRWDDVRRVATGLSYAEVARACSEAAKTAVLQDLTDISTDLLKSALKERSSITQDFGNLLTRSVRRIECKRGFAGPGKSGLTPLRRAVP